MISGMPSTALSLTRTLRVFAGGVILACLSACAGFFGGSKDPARPTTEAVHGARGSGLFAPYRVDIPQGNYLDRSMVEQVKTGMTRDQVRFALGTPLYVDPFRPDRWDYVFRFQHANLDAELRRVTVFFKDDKVERVQADPLPAANDPSDPALPGTRRSTGRNR
jgi:outer membrane protein assembly factor BamE (lipoprotein component of BamABCDE complex)